MTISWIGLHEQVLMKQQFPLFSIKNHQVSIGRNLILSSIKNKKIKLILSNQLNKKKIKDSISRRGGRILDINPVDYVVSMEFFKCFRTLNLVLKE